MSYRAVLFHGADECWGRDDTDLLQLLMASNSAMARERRGRKGSCDGGTVFKDGRRIYDLKDEHWVRVSP